MSDNYIDDYFKATNSFESPDSYIFWTALGTIAATLRHNVYWEGNYKVYPNIYVTLYAKSAATRKDAPIVFAHDLIDEIGNTKLFYGRFSFEAAVKELSELWINPKTKCRIEGAGGVIMSREIANQFPDADKACTALTELYDFHRTWKNVMLKNEGAQILNNVCLNLIVASNSEYFKGVFSELALTGGLLRRIFLVAETKKRKHISPLLSEKDDPAYRVKLVKHLKRLANYNGSVMFDDRASTEFNSFYASLEGPAEKDASGVLSSMHSSVMKVATLLAASEYDFDFIITKHHLEQAIDEVQKVINNTKIVMPLHTEEIATKYRVDLHKEIIKIMWELKGKPITHIQLVRKLGGKVTDIKVLENSLHVLIDHSKWLAITQHQGLKSYCLTDAFLDAYNLEPTKKEEKSN